MTVWHTLDHEDREFEVGARSVLQLEVDFAADSLQIAANGNK
jgi:hypothetical protein